MWSLGGSSLCEKVMLTGPTGAASTMTSIYDESNMQTVPTDTVPDVVAAVEAMVAELEEGEIAVPRGSNQARLDETGEAPQTPPASPRPEPECPGAPARPPRPAPLLMPQLSDHQGQGILAGDYIKPDPVMTRQETRRYVVAELERWLTGRICVHAKEISVAFDGAPEQVALSVAEGRWPAARLWLVLKGLENTTAPVGLPADPEERFHWVGRWATAVCVDHLHGYEAKIPAAQMAVGFVTTDILPCGRTIDSFWNYSPFDALRAAPPLPDHEPADALRAAPPLPDTDADVDADADNTETNAPEVVAPGIDDRLDQLTLDVWKALQLRVEIPLWAPLAFLGGFTAYLWLIVAVFVSR